MRGRRAGMALVTVGLALLAEALLAAPSRILIGDGLRATLSDSRSLYLEAQPMRGEGLYSLARRLCGGADAAAQIARENGGVKELKTDRRYRIAFELLKPELKTKVVRAVFREDRSEAVGWRHTISPRGQAGGESLWQIALWFTGAGENFAVLREVNALNDTEPKPGSRLLVPAEILLPEFRALLPKAVVAATAPAKPAPVPSSAPARPEAPVLPAPPLAAALEEVEEMETEEVVAAASPSPPVSAVTIAPAGEPERAHQAPPTPLPVSQPDETPADSPEAYDLRYGKDERGEFAVYGLRPGEALYSSVVVRFTGSIHAEDVNALAREIAARNGIADVTDIPIGFPVKVPLDVLLPEFLPAGHPRRVEYEAAVTASARFRNQVTAVDLEGITVILDAGHGGRDVGASMSGVWESLYVYDVMLRVRRLLETYTARDGGTHHPRRSQLRDRRQGCPGVLSRPRRADHPALSHRGLESGSEPALVPGQFGAPQAGQEGRRSREGDLHLDSRRFAAPVAAGSHDLHPRRSAQRRLAWIRRRSICLAPGSARRRDVAPIDPRAAAQRGSVP